MMDFLKLKLLNYVAGAPLNHCTSLDDVVVDLGKQNVHTPPRLFWALSWAARNELAGIQGRTFTPAPTGTQSQALLLKQIFVAFVGRDSGQYHVPGSWDFTMSGACNGGQPVWMQTALTGMGIRRLAL